MRRFPVTALLLIQYLPFAVFPAVLYDAPDRGFIITMVLAGVAVAVFVEGILSPLRASTVDFEKSLARARPGLYVGARRVAVGGLTSLLLAAATQVGSYAIVVGTSVQSASAPLITPLRPWTLIAAALFLVAWRAGQAPKATVLRWLGALVAAELLFAVYSAIIAPAAAFTLAVAFAAVLVGIFRPRSFLLAIAAGVLLWPLIVDARNEFRTSYGGRSATSASYIQYDAYERLRLDIFLGAAAKFDPIIDVGQPTWTQVLRYGLIPRALDQTRPLLSTGTNLNVAVGGGTTSSYTFTLLGNTYLLSGPLGLAGYLTSLSLLLFALLRRATAFTFAIAVLVVHQLAWMGSTYPDNVAGFLQTLVSCCLAWLVAVARRPVQARRKSQTTGSRVKAIS